MNSAVINLFRTCACFGVAITMFGTGINRASAQNLPGNTIIDILPVSVNTGAGMINGDTLELTSGELSAGGVIVEFEIRMSNWGATGDGVLLAVQTTIDGDGYCSGLGDSLYPVGYPGAPVISCPQGNGCPVDGSTCDQGGFINAQLCTVTVGGMLVGFGDPCGGGLPSCPAGEFCVGNPDYVFNDFNPIAVVAYPALDYEYASISQGGSKADATCVGGLLDGKSCGPQSECLTGTCTGPPISVYVATLLVEVPPGAKGTYTIDLTNDSERNFSSDGTAKSFSIVDVNSHPAFIVIPCVPGLDCEDCNACTTDIVNGDLSCSNVPNFVGGVECCDPSSGTITVIDDGNDCTRDRCDATTGVVSNSALIVGALCGGAPIGDCDAQNTCDFFGICTDNFASPGTACGDSSTTECSNPDSCDGSGVCETNDLNDGTLCDDGLFCSTSDTCTSGLCNGSARNCSDNIPCTTDTCDEGLNTCVNDAVGCMCTTIASSDPSNCTLDARIPHLRTQSASPLGWDSIDLDFNIGCSCDSLSIGDLSVSDVPGSPDSNAVTGQAVISGITGGMSNLCTVEFAAPIPTNQWTCITVKVTGEQRCIGSLPADVDSDQTVTLVDVTTLTSHLDFSTGLPHEVDINRDGESTTLDLVAVINLLTGADQFSTWSDANIAQTCP